MRLLEDHFPEFGRLLVSRRATAFDEEREDQVLPAASLSEIAALEAQLSIPLPASYKGFLKITRGVVFWEGYLQMDEGHPFVHKFPPLDRMTWRQRFDVGRIGSWPPPSQGMLCFADFWLDGEGDQALFDVSGGLVDGEYPVYYYNHERAEIRLLAPTFQEWLEEVVARGIIPPDKSGADKGF